MSEMRRDESARSERYVEKVRVPVRLSQPNLDPRDGCFLLFPQVGNEQRTESLLELLNSFRNVIPFILTGDDSVLLLTRTNIDWVAVSPAVDRKLILPSIEWTESQRVELRFLDERRVDAEVQWFSHVHQDRLSDFLNVCDTFVPAQTGFGTLIWNKDRLREARILPSAAQRFGETGNRAA